MPNEYYSPQNLLPGLNPRYPQPPRARSASVPGFYVLQPQNRPIPEPVAPGIGFEAYLRDPEGRFGWAGIHPGTLERMPAGNDLRAWNPSHQPSGRFKHLPREAYHHLTPDSLRPGAPVPVPIPKAEPLPAPVPVPVPIPRAHSLQAPNRRAQAAAAYGFTLPGLRPGAGR